MQLDRSVDLGKDRSRIKDPADGQRQQATANELLSRFFDRPASRRWECQILADEVGMGKTYIALATMWSVLQAMKANRAHPDLAGCYQKVLVLVPQNAALLQKWRNEVGEFVQRCVVGERGDERSFTPRVVERVDELPSALRSGSSVLIATTGVFGGAKLRDYDLKRRFLLSVLFRHWGTRFRYDERERLLKGAPAGWPADPRALGRLDEDERKRLPYDEDTALRRLGELDRKPGMVEALLERCRDIGQPYRRGREEAFGAVEQDLVAIHREIALAAIRSDLPLVVVDEAHNWKNHRHGYGEFVEHIAPRTRRLLLLSATPFQLRPEELLQVLAAADRLSPCPTQAESAIRRDRLVRHRTEVLKKVLDSAESASRQFSRAWARLPASLLTEVLATTWAADATLRAREALRALADAEGVVDAQLLESIIEPAVSAADARVRELLRAALNLHVHNADLSAELGRVAVRHRRRTEHRLVRVGSEYERAVDVVAARMDRHVLHAAPGIDVRGAAELPHYLLMRCVSEMKRQKGRGGRSSLGSDLTGCWSTLVQSAEGTSIQKLLRAGDGAVYLDLLAGMVTEKDDETHPKVRAVVDALVEAWKAGEKSLVFCFRTHTARRLRKILDDRIRAEMDDRRTRCLGGDGLRTLRGRLTGRDRDLVGLGLDRVLWSWWWANPRTAGYTPNELRPIDADLEVIAATSASYGIDLASEHPDRVFLTRALENAVAARLLRGSSGATRALLQVVADPSWVEAPYGVRAGDEDDDGAEDAPAYDERGVHSVYPRLGAAGAPDADGLRTRREHALRTGAVPLVDAYAVAACLWLGADPVAAAAETAGPMFDRLHDLHGRLWKLTGEGSDWDWSGRLQVMQALRRAVLRESVLVRLLPDRTDLGEATWGELLARAFHEPLGGQNESMADRIRVFLEDLCAASGSLHAEGTARHGLFDATRLRDHQFVALVDGSTKAETRNRVFAGFNTPLLPEILVCTSVGQEGIDLHRQCRLVVHYDLAWNPAVVEQRTGRTDRIGSKTFRERAVAPSPLGPFLEVGVPYLAGTYDERMFEELRLRAQTFEVLTGGDLAIDSADGGDEAADAQGEEAGLRFVPLPPDMVDGLRVRLEVWPPRTHPPASTAIVP